MEQLFEMTSGDFCANGHFDDICGNRWIDLAFIDGMHLFEYTLRGSINIERRGHDNSVVLIHDIIPMNLRWAPASGQPEPGWVMFGKSSPF